MENLSIQEKAKAYDKVIERANSLLSGNQLGNAWIYKLLPELKESEDERIRKELFKHLKEGADGYEPAGNSEDYKRWLGWFEKQGETFTKKDVDDAYLKGICVAKHELEKQGKQKPIDNVEPKFEVDNWVVYGDQTLHIVGVFKDGYATNNSAQGFIPKEREHSMRLWTIQDAKDGDVLSDGNLPFIFKKIDTNKYSYAYCGISVDDGFRIESEGKLGEWTWMQDIKPATKEQRDTLMKAMTDAGYTFDFDKKELKEIVVPIFNIGDTIIKKHNSDINDFGQFTITDITGGKYWYNDRIICDIIEQDEWELYEPVRQNPAEWSEEDENIRQWIISDIEKLLSLKKKSFIIADKEIDWLKSLKERI